MIYPSQAEFIQCCMDKYLFTDIPADQQWEAAHFPLPRCSGEDDTVQLWSADHTVQGLLQSIEFDHQCFHGYRNKHDTDLLTAYWPVYLPLFKQLKLRFNSRGGKIVGKKHAENKTGVCGRSAEQMTADGKKGGIKAGKKGGKKGAPVQHAQRWQCLVTDYISTPCGLSNYQKARGIDTSLRERVYCTTANPTLELQ